MKPIDYNIVATFDTPRGQLFVEVRMSIPDIKRADHEHVHRDIAITALRQLYGQGLFPAVCQPLNDAAQKAMPYILDMDAANLAKAEALALDIYEQRQWAAVGDRLGDTFIAQVWRMDELLMKGRMDAAYDVAHNMLQARRRGDWVEHVMFTDNLKQRFYASFVQHLLVAFGHIQP